MADENCYFCQLAKSVLKTTVYEDKDIKADLVENPAYPGQIAVYPKAHFTILEQVPVDIIQKIFVVSNKLSSILFDSLNIHGTNIIISNGVSAGQTVPHFSLMLIPRMENDGINFEWKPKTLSNDEMSEAELMLKPFADGVGTEPAHKEPIKLDSKKPTISDEKSNYLLRQLRRIP